MHQHCYECLRLGSEYALATRHYLKLQGRVQIAAISHDDSSVRELTPLLAHAEVERTRLQMALEYHSHRAFKEMRSPVDAPAGT